MKKLMYALVVLLWAAGMQAQTSVIAHRGYWKTEGSAQNSIASLQKAARAKVYGSEFDVQLTADGKMVVNHDDVIEDITIADVPYSKLKKLKLKNGESLPKLEKYLKTGKGLDVQLILEIKPHKTKGQEDRITRQVVSLVKSRHMEKQVEYISFSLNVCELLAQLTRGSEISYLKGDMSPLELKSKGITGIDYHYNVLYKHPEWIEQAHQNGMKVNAWTVDKEADMKKLIDMKVDFLTTDEPLVARRLLE